MAFIKLSMILCSVALLLMFVERSVALASSEWLFMARHGECAQINSLERKVPDLGDVRDPSAFIQLMRDKG